MKKLVLMNDTDPEITRKMCKMIQLKSPEERLKMGCSMNETSRYLVTQAILKKEPDLSTTRLRQEIFLRYYGNDFNLESREKILRQL